jgi:hypothetical protein
MTGKQKNQMIMIGVLVLILLGVVLNSIRTVKKKKAEAEAARQKALAAQTSAAPAAPAPAAATPVPVAAAAPSVSAPVAIPPQIEEAKPEDIEKQKQIAEGEWGTDPFYHGAAYRGSEQKGSSADGTSSQDAAQQASYSLPTTVESSLALTGITRAGENYIAVINRKIVRSGDTVSQDNLSYTVKDIQKDRVIVEMNGGSYELKLRK